MVEHLPIVDVDWCFYLGAGRHDPFSLFVRIPRAVLSQIAEEPTLQGSQLLAIPFVSLKEHFPLRRKPLRGQLLFLAADHSRGDAAEREQMHNLAAGIAQAERGVFCCLNLTSPLRHHLYTEDVLAFKFEASNMPGDWCLLEAVQLVYAEDFDEFSRKIDDWCERHP